MGNAMRIAVTGAAGRIARHLRARSDIDSTQVRWIDVVPPPDDLTSGEWVTCDLADASGLASALEGIESVIHLGAVSEPRDDNRLELVKANIVGTAALLEAVNANNVQRLVMASSICATGLLYSPRPWVPRYVPVDEAHPTYPQDYYGISKLAGEQMAASCSLRSRIETVALRLCSVYFPDLPGQSEEFVARSFDEEGAGRIRLWSYVHVEDVIDVALAALNASSLPHWTIVNVGASDTLARSHTMDLLHRHLPGVPIQGPLVGHASLISTNRLEDMFGLKLTRSWREDDDG